MLKNKFDKLANDIKFVESIILRSLTEDEIALLADGGVDSVLESLDVRDEDLGIIIEARDILSAYITETEDDEVYEDLIINAEPDTIEIFRNIVADYDMLQETLVNEVESEDKCVCKRDEEQENPLKETHEQCMCVCKDDVMKKEDDVVTAIPECIARIIAGEEATMSTEHFDMLTEYVAEHYDNFILRYEDGKATLKV